MNQQEFEPESQSNQQHSSNEDDEIQHPQYPYSWSGNLNQEGVPRDEPPSSYDATVMQQGYQGQTSSNANDPGSSSQSRTQGRYEYVAPEGDGDAYEQGYRPYNAFNRGQGQGVPPWARPQPHPRRPARFALILLVLLGVGFLTAMLGSTGPMMGFMGDVFGTIMLVILFVIMVPIFILFVIFGVIFRMFRPYRSRYWRRGPWW